MKVWTRNTSSYILYSSLIYATILLFLPVRHLSDQGFYCLLSRINTLTKLYNSYKHCIAVQHINIATLRPISIVVCFGGKLCVNNVGCNQKACWINSFLSKLHPFVRNVQMNQFYLDRNPVCKGANFSGFYLTKIEFLEIICQSLLDHPN